MINIPKTIEYLSQNRTVVLTELKKFDLHFEEKHYDAFLVESFYKASKPHIILTKAAKTLLGPRLLYFSPAPLWFFFDPRGGNQNPTTLKESTLITFLNFLGRQILKDSFNEKVLNKSLELLKR